MATSEENGPSELAIEMKQSRGGYPPLSIVPDTDKMGAMVPTIDYKVATFTFFAFIATTWHVK